MLIVNNTDRPQGRQAPSNLCDSASATMSCDISYTSYQPRPDTVPVPLLRWIYPEGLDVTYLKNSSRDDISTSIAIHASFSALPVVSCEVYFYPDIVFTSTVNWNSSSCC